MITKSLRTDEQWKKLIRIAKDMRHAGYVWSIVRKRLKCDVRTLKEKAVKFNLEIK